MIRRFFRRSLSLVVLSLGVGATVATQPSVPVRVFDEAETRLTLSAETPAVERNVMIGINEEVLGAEGGFVARLDIRGCVVVDADSDPCFGDERSWSPLNESLRVERVDPDDGADTIDDSEDVPFRAFETTVLVDEGSEETVVVTISLPEGAFADAESVEVVLSGVGVVEFPDIDRADPPPAGAEVTVTIEDAITEEDAP